MTNAFKVALKMRCDYNFIMLSTLVIKHIIELDSILEQMFFGRLESTYFPPSKSHNANSVCGPLKCSL